MIAVNLQVRPAVFADHQQLADLLFFESRVHRHLDWHAPLDWLGSPYYWVVEERGQVAAALACPPDPPGIAWVRLFVCAAPLSGPSAWLPLWEAARLELSSHGGATAAAIALQDWFEPLLRGSGFYLHQHIVVLKWSGLSFPPRSVPHNIALRAMTGDDLPRVAELDAAAFDPLWQNSLEALSKAYPQALFASVAEMDGEVIGYQLSTGNPFGVHLARLAVRPEAQGGGIGQALVSDLILRMRQRGLSQLTVNTQIDNRASLALYERNGFRRTGEQHPVYKFEVQ